MVMDLASTFPRPRNLARSLFLSVRSLPAAARAHQPIFRDIELSFTIARMP
jgi:hypothetical protein